MNKYAMYASMPSTMIRLQKILGKCSFHGEVYLNNLAFTAGYNYKYHYNHVVSIFLLYKLHERGSLLEQAHYLEQISILNLYEQNK